MVPGSTPRRWPASSASCLISDLLLPPGNPVLIASQSRKSASCIWHQTHDRCDWSHLGRTKSNLGSVVVRLDPADVPVFPAVDHVELAGRAVPEQEGGRVPE